LISVWLERDENLWGYLATTHPHRFPLSPLLSRFFSELVNRFSK
jgi:hypothetical protein